jgi:hypothetical protein
MKKIFTVLALVALTAMFVGCNYTENKNVAGVGIPEHVQFIQFDNGGRVVLEGQNVDVSLKVVTNESLLSFTSKGNQVQFYTYVLKGDIRVYMADGSYRKVDAWDQIDSESLSIGYVR